MIKYFQQPMVWFKFLVEVSQIIELKFGGIFGLLWLGSVFFFFFKRFLFVFVCVPVCAKAEGEDKLRV